MHIQSCRPGAKMLPAIAAIAEDPRKAQERESQAEKQRLQDIINESTMSHNSRFDTRA